jgi:NAD(P)-dependent dehydrogenase (short-subunit alcohol dehydrogenase family)
MSKGVTMKTALITGASRGLGLALAEALARKGWRLVITARGEVDLKGAATRLAALSEVVAIAGDIASSTHRRRLVDAIAGHASVAPTGLDLLVNNASILGPSQARLADYPAHEFMAVYQVNLFAPVALTQLALPALRACGGRVLDITSDAAHGAYPGWGGYGSAKAALEQFSNVLGAEEPGIRVYAVDPGEMQTAMLREAFPHDDLSDRANPADVAEQLLALVDGDLPSGRYSAGALEVRS